MRQLQENGAAPPGDDDDLAIDFPGDGARTRSHGAGAKQPRANRRTMSFERRWRRAHPRIVAQLAKLVPLLPSPLRFPSARVVLRRMTNAQQRSRSKRRTPVVKSKSVTRDAFDELQRTLQRLTDTIESTLPLVQRSVRDHELTFTRMAQLQQEIDALKKTHS